MKKLELIIIGLSLSFLVLLAGCSKKTESNITLNYSTVNDEYVQAVSPTYINRLSEITVSFSKEIICSEDDVNKAVSLVPHQQGKFKLVDEKTISFVPEKSYKPNSTITLNADVNKLLGAKESAPIYSHPFVISGPTFDVSFNDLVLNANQTAYSLSGKIKTDIPFSAEKISKCINAKIGQAKVRIQLEALSHGKELREWDFSIPEIQIGKNNQIFKVAYEGKNIGLNRFEKKAYAGKKNYIIPGVNSDFSIININTTAKNAISFSFSKPLDTAQDIIEYISLFDRNNKKLASKISPAIKNNVLTIYSDEGFEDVDSITISDGILSSSGALLAAKTTVPLSTKWDVPEVRFMTEGNILPTSQGTVIPVETKNLSGLLIQAFVVYDSNINQFFQINSYDGSYDLYRVGEPVWEKNVSFDWNDSMQNKFIPRGIDISDLVKKYPDGMLQLKITFRKHNIKYVCSNTHGDFSKYPFPKDTIGGEYKPREKSNWDSIDYDGLSYEQRSTFWTYRNDPCHPAFYLTNYNYNIVIKKNIFVSDIGLMAKQDMDGKLYVTAANLKTTEPMHNLSVKTYNFIGTKLDELKTDKDGRAIFEDGASAYTVVATDGKQVSYLVINSGTALSTSHFETGGVIAENGVKGFIYGERGVWRPGDDIYLTFVLQDEKKSLPENIPVIFTFTDPRGREVERRTLTESVNGFYSIPTKTLPDAETGLWNARVKIGGKEWNKSVRVETVVPNHLAVNLEIEKDFLSAGINEFVLKGAWLYGADTPNYAADVTVNFTEGNTTFDGYSEYCFENPAGYVDSSKDTIFNGKLDSDSKVKFSRRLSAGKNIPGKLKAHFVSRIFEPSGIPSLSSTVYEFSPFRRYVGLKLPKGDESRNMLLTDVNHVADVVLLNEDGTPVESAKLNYTIYKMDWKWWWEKDAYSSATYVGNNSYTRIDNGIVEIENGKGSFDFEVSYPSWGRYLIQVSDGYNGHVTGKVVYIDWPGWAGRSLEEGSGSTAMLPLSVDKKQYTAGETAKISFASTKGQRALVTVEKSGNVLNQYWVTTDDGTTVWQLPLTKEMAPNVYVHVTLLQPHLQTKNSLPIRVYGVVPVMVDNPETLLEPVITCKERFEPSANTVISVSEKNGKPMTYTIAVVDEGLLGLTAYRSPDLRKEFYKKEASMLENYDLYKYVMNAYSGKLETILAIGGSEEIIDSGDKNENRFTPVVKYFGPFTIKEGEKKATEFEMPNYIGAVRIMVLAGNEGAYGVTERSVPVKSNLMILPSAPRTLGLNEEIMIPVEVYNGMDVNRKISVSMEIDGVIEQKLEQTVNITPNTNETLYFGLSTKNAKEGIANFTFKASSGPTSQYAKMSVPVESRGIPVTYSSDFTVKGKGNQTVTVESPTESGSATLTAEITSMPLVNLNNRLKYLIQYPHGCIEQITSGGFPQMYLADFVNLSSEKNEQIIQNVNSVLERYPRYQNVNGSFSYWAGGGTAHLWGSTYAAHFMTEAKKHGYHVADSVYNPLINWIAESAQNFGSYFDEEESIENQVYSLYVLALANHADIGSMNRIRESVKADSSKLLLASAYALCGRVDTAKDLVKTVKFDSAFYRRLDKNFSSSLRNQSIALMAFNYVGNSSMSSKYAKTICDQLNSNMNLNTQETAWALFTLLPYYDNEKGEQIAYSVNSNGKTLAGEIEKRTVLLDLPMTNGAKQEVAISNTGKRPLYGRVSVSGKSVPGTEVTKAVGLKLSVTYEDKDFNKISPTNLKKGDTFRITVNVRNNASQDLSNVAVTIPIPTAWEFINDRLTSTNDSSNDFTYQDIRDDYIYTYLDLKNHASKQFKFNATVVYDGSYYVPAIHAEAMYDEDISAIVPGIYVKK